MFNPDQVKLDFPILSKLIHGKPLVYLDSAATSQKPRQVIQAITNYYKQSNANVHRGVHQLGDDSTKAFHTARRVISAFFGASPEELIVVRNTTEALNQVAYSWGESHIQADDIIMVTQLEHHSNLVPWQQLAQRKQAKLVFLPVTDEGMLDLNFLNTFDYKKNAVKILAFSHISNTLGSIAPVKEMIKKIRHLSPQTKIVIDGAQAVPHVAINFSQLDADFYAMSAHKMLGPMGIGGLLVKQELIKDLPPFFFGGGMISEVAEEETTFVENLEERFTAGTPDVAGLVGWAAACEYLTELGMDNVQEHDRHLVKYTLDRLSQIPELQIVGPQTADQRLGSVTFMYKSVHAHDVGQILDSQGVAVRSGHHCTMPLHARFGWQATLRASFNVYSSQSDIDALVIALQKVKQIFGL